MNTNKILFNLIKNNKYDEFAKIIENEDIDVNLRDEFGNYFLTYAIVKNNPEILKLLLGRGARVDIFDVDGKSILYLPIKYGYDNILKIIIDHDKDNVGMFLIDTKDTHGNVPIHYAIYFKNIFAIRILLDNGSDLDLIDSGGNNSLHLAVYAKDYDICKWILDKGVNINARTIVGETALHIAVNFQLEDIVILLTERGIDLNQQDFGNEITALIYAININSNRIAKYLVQKGVNPNIQDYIGNTAAHYCIIEDNLEILTLLLSIKEINLSIHNIMGKFPIHIFLDKGLTSPPIQTLIEMSNLNWQDMTGNTALTLLCKENIWGDYVDILIKKKLNIFIKNKENKRPIDYIEINSRTKFLEMVTNSYIYTIKNGGQIWNEEWQNVCAKDQQTDDDIKTLIKYGANNCRDLISNELKNERSYPQKRGRCCLNIANSEEVEYCSFTGMTLDILIGLIYLLKKHQNTCSTLGLNFIKNTDLCNYYATIGFSAQEKCEFLNFEIVWIYKKLFFSENFKDNFKKCISNSTVRFVIIPLGIEMSNDNHANYLIFDKSNYEIERFEPYGSQSPYKFNYNAKLLDNVVSFKLKEIDNKISYIAPSEYLPKIGFQYFDIYESNTRKISDPGGFCALWSIWYTDMRLTYPDVNRLTLVNKLFKEISKQNIFFRNLIRNYSTNVVSLRDDIFNQAGVNINMWINDQYTDEQYNVIIDQIKLRLNPVLRK